MLKGFAGGSGGQSIEGDNQHARLALTTVP